MSLEVGVVMDPIESINFKKDSTLAMLLAAQRRGWSLHYMRMGDLFVRDGVSHAHMRGLRVANDPGRWFELDAPRTRALGELGVILMRKDPPVDMEFVYSTYILETGGSGGDPGGQPAAEPARREREDVHGMVCIVLPPDARDPLPVLAARIPRRTCRHHRQAPRRNGRHVHLPGQVR